MSESVENEQWRKHYSSPKGFRFWPCEELVRWVGERHFGSILEAGCGNGGNLWYLACHGQRVVGVDSCQLALEAAERCIIRPQRLVHQDINVRLADVRQLPFGDGEFELLVDCMTSQHLKWAEHEALYREYRRVLKPGGWLWLYHLDGHTKSVLGDWKGASDYGRLALFPDVDLFSLPTPMQLSNVVEAAGFKQPTVRGLAREYQDGSVAHYTVLDAEAA